MVIRMKKYIVLSVDDNPKYLYYLPLVVWAWRKFGWEPILFTLKNCGAANLDNRRRIIQDVLNSCCGGPIETNYIHLFTEYKSETIVQVSRLYAACRKIGYLMTGDIDMIPLSDYWKPNENEITVWGHDLTSYQHYPICYISMPSYRWIEIMGLTTDLYSDMIKRDLDSMPNARSEDSVKRWVVDQDLITERLNATQFSKHNVIRGTYENGYPIGRVDRSAWNLKHDVLIDCHAPHDVLTNEASFTNLIALLMYVWPEENFEWFIDYTNEFKKTLNG